MQKDYHKNLYHKNHNDTDVGGDGSLRGVFRGIIEEANQELNKKMQLDFLIQEVKQNINLQVRYGGEPGQLDQYPNREGVLTNKPLEDFIKFRIRDAVNGRYIIFPL